MSDDKDEETNEYLSLRSEYKGHGAHTQCQNNYALNTVTMQNVCLLEGTYSLMQEMETPQRLLIWESSDVRMGLLG